MVQRVNNLIRFGISDNKKIHHLLVDFLAGATGFEPAISALTGPHVEPLHHAPERLLSYHTEKQMSSNFLNPYHYN